MEDNGDFRCWDELIPDALGMIFKNLSLQETLTVVPSVCKSWRMVVTGPYCKDIDVEQWSQQCRPEILDRMLQMLITRSSGSLRKLCVTRRVTDPWRWKEGRDQVVGREIKFLSFGGIW
ncbi:hypothetical protein HRI_000794800 [Hibiscus trionum]|uniref:F-box domain-containing protein n=1 Tax=Hibiscus trionum TaxID=183268 RepID=A0A9W7LQ08_HIBTR|nr:hypothetical protein HRI_000794800 [Hibiscus trionum]